MSHAEELYQLQEIELNLLKSRKRLTEIKTQLEADEVVQQARARLEHAQKTLSPLQTKARNLDLEIQSNQEKARQTEQSLYSGNVKNPKELQDMQQEIQSLKKRHGELETQLLETMFAVEEAEAQVAEAEAELGAVIQSWEAAHQTLLAEKSKVEVQVQHLNQSRQSALSSVDQESLRTYEAMKPRKHNQPVARMEGNTCSICGVAQNMAVEREVRIGQKLAYCTNCGRILVAR